MSDKTINWEKALGYHHTRNRDGFIETCLPYAQKLARIKSKKYEGTKINTRLDENEFLSHALEGLIEVYDMRLNTEDTNPESFNRLCYVMLSRHMSEHENEAAKPVAQNHYMNDDKPYSLRHKSTAFRWREDSINEFLKTVLPAQQARVMCALVTYLPKGYTHSEVADMLEIKYNSFISHVNQAKSRLETDFPALGRRIISDVLESDVTQMHELPRKKAI